MRGSAASEALARLRAGNRRFVTEAGGRASRARRERRAELAERQEPCAVILGCSDSRVPPEIVFDQGLGDLFVIRIAGHVVVPAVVESVEFGAATLGARLVVVLGHSGCGAVTAALEPAPARAPSPDLSTILDRIRTACRGAPAAEKSDPAERVGAAVRANVRASVERLREDSEVLRRLVEEEGLVLVGAEYSLESGEVEFLGPVPA